ncbi:hypothetical protein F4860DRAFT_511748 [Xylaria cubensis]|nr:hypothetical protein F4860DRAFT_511748 [Xylaria cubensis]
MPSPKKRKKGPKDPEVIGPKVSISYHEASMWRDVTTHHIRGYCEDDSDYRDDDIDESYNPEQGDLLPDFENFWENQYNNPSSDTTDQSHDESDSNQSENGNPQNKLKRKRSRSYADFGAAWLSFLEKQPDIDLLSPRVSCIVQLVKELRRNHADEKIVIVSYRIMLLDIIHEALKRISRRPDQEPGCFDAKEFNGTINSVEDRAKTAQALISQADGDYYFVSLPDIQDSKQSSWSVEVLRNQASTPDYIKEPDIRHRVAYYIARLS